MTEQTSVKVEMREPGEIRRELEIEVEADVVAEKMETIVRQLSKSARIPGFRKGKVPTKLVRRRFSQEIENEVLEQVVPTALRDALEQKSLLPIHEPVIKDVSIIAGEPLRFTATFEVRPKIEPRDYRGVVIQEQDIRVEEKDVERELEAMRDRAADYESVEPRPLQSGDFAVVDQRSLARDEGEDGTGDARTRDGVMIEVGGDDYHPDFNRNLEGMSPGDERSFVIRYGDGEPDPRARGKVIDYTVVLREIKNKVLPPLDDDFAQDVSEHDNLVDLKAEVRVNLQQQLAHRQRSAQLEQLQDRLLAEIDAEMPNALIEGELDHALEEQVRALANRGVDPRTAPIDWRQMREQLRDSAVRSVKWNLLLESIADKEEIAVSEPDLQERLARIAEASGRSLEYTRSNLEKDGRMEELTRSLKLAKTVDFLLANARIELR